MIKHGLIDWIINKLQVEKNSLSQFSYEYLIALLMNLALRTEGKKRCEKIPQIIEMFIELLNNVNFAI